MTQGHFGTVVLRLGLAALFMWFGLSQLADTSAWSIWVPQWAGALSGLSPETIVLLNGSFELLAGFLIAVGFKVRILALLLAAHLVVIAFDIGLADPTGVRDLALAVATFALAFLPGDSLTFDRRASQQIS